MTVAARVGFDARMLGAGGIGRYIEGLLPELVTQAPAFDWVVFARRSDLEQIKALAPAARMGAVDGTYYRLGEQASLWWHYRSARLDLLHAPHYNQPLGYRGRTIVTIHDLIPMEFPALHSGWLPRAYHRLLIRAAVGRARAIITPSRASAEAVQRRLHPRCRVVPIREGVAPRWFARGPAPGDQAVPRALGIAAPYFLYVGQWQVHRDVSTAIRALARARTQAPTAQLVLAGRRDPRRPEIPQLIEKLQLNEAVKMLGPVSDESLAALYRNAAAVVVPSLQEGFGLPVLEAMASGAPVICSDIPVLRETAGDAAIRCTPQDEADFGQAMLRTLDPGERARLVAAGSRQAAAFRWSTAASETLTVYRDVLRGGCGDAPLPHG